MSVDKNFQQIWGFRGRDDDVDSSSDDSKSGEANHKLASVVLPVNDETSDDLDHQKTDNVEVEPVGVQPRKPRIKKGVTAKAKGKKKKTEDALKKEVGKKARGRKRKPEDGFKKEAGKKKRKSSALHSSLLDELKIFTLSIIKDLEVEREQMFARMKEDMQKLVSIRSSRQATKTKGRHGAGENSNKRSTRSEMRPRNCSDEILERSIVSIRMSDSNINHSNTLQEHAKCDQAVETISLNKKEKGGLARLLAEQPMYSYNQSDHIASSAYLMLPSAPSEKQLEHQSTESPFRNCLKPGGVAGNGNGTGLSFASGHGNVTLNAMNHCGYISGSHVEVPFPIPSFAQMGSKNMRSFSDQQCTQTSSMGNVVPLPLHQRFENSFNIPSQVGNLSGDSNMLGWRMNGGNIIFSGNGGNALPENIAGNMVLNRIHYRTNGKVAEYGIQDIRDGNLI